MKDSFFLWLAVTFAKDGSNVFVFTGGEGGGRGRRALKAVYSKISPG